jgi:hypothetical protein
LKRVAQLWVSLNSHIPEEYERVMGLKFERTARNLDHLHSLDDFPHAVMLSTVGYPNEEFRYYCFERWPKFESMAIKKDAWLGFTDAQVTQVPDTACSRWFELSIAADGFATTCCMHSGSGAEDPYNIGDVRTQTLYQIYNAPKWRDRREGLVSRKTLDMAETPCAGCTY